MKLKNLVLSLLVVVPSANAFYLPGLNPQNYKEGDKVELVVNALQPIISKRDQKLRSVLPLSYYKPEFHFCEPKVKELKSENLGSVLFGDRLYSSPYEINMLRNSTCKLLCEKEIPAIDGEFINEKIKEHYAHDWLIDGLPVSHDTTKDSNSNSLYSIGFTIGEANNNDIPIFYNHFDIIIQYHTTDYENYRVVGAQVYPKSKDTKLKNGVPDCSIKESLRLSSTLVNKEVLFTYSVGWEYSETPWATRWDAYLKIPDSTIHWFSLINSSVIVLFLTGMVAMILLRALHKDISRYNQIETQEDIQEDFGWKLVHGDVFRNPSHSMLLSIMVGNGLQLLGMAFVTLVFATLGFLTPTMRGSLVTCMVVLYMLFGLISGYTSSRLYKMFQGQNLKTNMILTAILFPGIIFTLFILLNFFLIGSGSSAAVPFSTMFTMITLWFLISIPLSLFGSYLGFKKPRITHQVRTNQIPRQIPAQPMYLKLIPTILVGGILPFGAIFLELYFIMNSLWFHRLYYIFGFLFLVFIILILTCSQVSILLCYFHLCSENYHWWWRSYFTAGASAFYVFLLSILYFFTRLQLDSFSSIVIYFGWSIIVSVFTFLITGSAGFIACLLFVRKIYRSIKID
ncbi:hypothetical protein K502DRAFT_323171 [Neoconidiobolus thromboides FSU 785]|nr:hypothetical protein K502DRAFT_323171 [Neoconidiobolus thromboides FSU 785]